MPPVFALGEKTNKTYYQMIVGKDAVFEARKKTRILDIHDGTSNTLGIVEAARAVPWTKPEDLPYVPDQALPALGGIFGGDFNACMMDGSVRLFSKNIPEATLRALITRGGAEVIDFNKLPPAGSNMSHATLNELRHLNQRLLYDLRAAEEDIRAARSEKWLRLKDLHDLGSDRPDAPLQDLLNANRFLLDAIERSKAELEGLRRERARLDALLREMKSK